MKQFLALVIVGGIFFSGLASYADVGPQANAECLNPSVLLEDGTVRPATEDEIATKEISVICCCSTTMGGMCCADVAVCMGGIIIGCFCHGDSPPVEGDRL